MHAGLHPGNLALRPGGRLGMLDIERVPVESIAAYVTGIGAHLRPVAVLSVSVGEIWDLGWCGAA